MRQDRRDSVHQQQAGRDLDRRKDDHQDHGEAMAPEAEAARREGEQQVRRQRIDQTASRERQSGDRRHGRGLEVGDVPDVPDGQEERAGPIVRAAVPGDRARSQVREPDELGLDDRDRRHTGAEGDEAGLDRHGESDGRPQPECPRALHVHGLGWSSIGLRRSLVRGPGGRRSSSACSRAGRSL